MYPSNLTVDYAPNALGQPTKAGTFASNVSYHPGGAVKQFTYGNGIVHTTTLNARGLPQRILDQHGPSATRVLDDTLDYDPNGNLFAVTDGATNRQQRGNRDMTYDGLDRLLTATSPMWNGTAGYAYDVLDNLVHVVVPQTAMNAPRNDWYCYDASNRMTNIKSGGCGGSTTSGLGYDVRGNLQNFDGQVYQFDYGNRLRTANGLEQYRYDGLGRRVLSFSVQGLGNILSQYSKEGRLVYQDDRRAMKGVDHVYLGHRLVARRARTLPGGTDPVVTYLHTDALGSPVVSTTSTGNEDSRSEYEPYGQLTNRLNDNRPGHTGHVMDAETGLTYMQQRYYDPGIGMFLSVDPVAVRPIGDNFNRYWYANNNPYTNTDPDGRECNGKGCWVTPAEREAAASGNWREYYQRAGSAGDGYAQRAGEVASNTGSTPLNETLSNVTNKVLSDSIAINMGADPQNLSTGQQVAVEFKMEGVRVGLAKAHVQALDDAGASPSNPVSLDRAVIGEFHKEVFKANGADPSVFGGFKIDALEQAVNVFGGTTRDIYDYCPSPSCKN